MQGGTRGRNALTDGDPGKSHGTGSNTLPGNWGADRPGLAQSQAQAPLAGAERAGLAPQTQARASFCPWPESGFSLAAQADRLPEIARQAPRIGRSAQYGQLG